jgi:membrane-bound lytic murein transglycosylase D
LKKVLLSLIFLFTPAHIFVAIPVFAAIPLDCCALTIRTPESNPLLKSLPELQVPLSFALQSELPPQASIRATYTLQGMNATQAPFIDQEIVFFQTAFKERFEKYLSRSGRYLPIVQKIMKESDVHEDIAYLPLIESGFNPMAVSRAKAAGLWQFMKTTAKHYGLRVDKWIDERYDAVKSTKAAMEYFKDLYAMFGSWPLSMASYNAGEGRIGRTLAATGAADYWELKAMGRMPKETRDYVPKFMAATMIAKDPEAYGFSVAYETPMRYDEVLVPRQTSLLAISRITNVSLAEIKAYNPELRRGATPPNYPGYLLKLPLGKKAAFLAKYSEIPKYAEERVRRSRSKRVQNSIKTIKTEAFRPQSVNSPVKHRIKEGETVALISEKYKISQTKILNANRLNKNSVIRAGRSLLIPRG